MPTIPESGLQITLPEGMYFRFQDIPEYIKLKGQHLREMDFSWWDTDTNTLWLLEVNDYTSLSRTDRLSDHLLPVLEAKVVDSLMMLAAMWSGTVMGKKFRARIPVQLHSFPTAPPRTSSRIRVVIVLKIEKRHITSDLPPLKDKLKENLQGRISLFDILGVQLLDHHEAINLVQYPISL